MPTQELEIFFPYTVENIYNLVADIEKYPLFLPNCVQLTVKKRHKTVKNEHILAEMGVKYGIFSENFSSNVELDAKNHSIIVGLNSGPIKKLNNHWRIEKHDNGSLAHFKIEIEMKNFALKIALAAAFKFAVNEVVEAFKTRADELYST
ncbi:MAG: type II toxin-antitoxin system RatA family toxin [Rhizobiales bacterium]|nr:type II toxin-antitoxin system RatA family toxin [Hyphomicrobiales bacterium]NRB15077.1 type II toxin-antitoxin system RatA family toxin [Hyphomicrobiales bacterium]